MFYDDAVVLLHHPPVWLLDRFIRETLSVDWDAIARVLKRRWTGEGSAPVADIEYRLSELLVMHVRSIWSNPPRHRRFLMKSLLDWQLAYDLVVRTVARLDLSVRPSLPPPAPSAVY